MKMTLCLYFSVCVFWRKIQPCHTQTQTESEKICFHIFCNVLSIWSPSSDCLIYRPSQTTQHSFSRSRKPLSPSMTLFSRVSGDNVTQHSRWAGRRNTWANNPCWASFETLELTPTPRPNWNTVVKTRQSKQNNMVQKLWRKATSKDQKLCG